VYTANPQYKANRSDDFVYPAGTGIFLLSGRDNVFENNRVHGNFLMGLGVAQNPFLKSASVQELQRNRFTGNVFGANGADKNGRDAVYTTNGVGNCFSNNPGMAVTVPSDPAAFPACPNPGAGPQSGEGFAALADWGVAGNYRKGWLPQAHAPGAGGVVPIDGSWQDGKRYGPKTL
jgi:hypothetical protein